METSRVTLSSIRPARPMRDAGAMLRRRGLYAAVLSAMFLTGARASALDPAPEAAEADEDDEGFTFEAFIALRAYVVSPKARFRKGSDSAQGSSIRTQRVGLDDSDFALGGQAGVWLGAADRFELGLWLFSASGHTESTRPMTFGGAQIPPGTSLSIDYALTSATLEYGHRFQPLGDWCWLDVGLRLDYLEMKLTMLRYGRLKLESVWPVPRLRIGVRPVPWLELEGGVAGFNVTTLSFGQAEATQPLEITAVVRALLPRNAFIEAGATTYHVHLEHASGDMAEDALHLHQRAMYLALGVKF
jgi:hypothetical protein